MATATIDEARLFDDGQTGLLKDSQVIVETQPILVHIFVAGQSIPLCTDLCSALEVIENRKLLHSPLTVYHPDS